MALACPTQLIGVIDGVYYFNATICDGTTSSTTANDTRDHTLGIDCANTIDPITVLGPVPIPTPTKCAEVRCGCVHTGLHRYTSLKSTVILASGFNIEAEFVVRYLDCNGDGQQLERFARLFVINGSGAWRKKAIHIGQEIAPGSNVSGVLEGTLEHPLGHHQCVKTPKGLFHVMTKSYLQPVPGPDASKGGAAQKGGYGPKRRPAKGRRA